ncbi:hypothetical protein FEM48_Zijuj05G0175900 [Ziziphus jujuba var. spinosa]|uniref:Uncharacterized protein n=1 Tax=Ziziphus jujuba var. spinosa TaxID=714518 RepID=A0A978VG70_ZIZJJ|nr:hypothetical protein FEM48_Zijuj05G0175900 [Ziziphus jujuba var. spinosa]
MEYLTSIDITGTVIKELTSKFKLLVGMGEFRGITFSEKLILIPGLLSEPISNWDERYGRLELLDTVLRFCHLSKVDFIMYPSTLFQLQWLDLSKHKFVGLPSLMESTESEVEVVMHTSGNNQKLIANLPPKSIKHIDLQTGRFIDIIENLCGC